MAGGWGGWDAGVAAADVAATTAAIDLSSDITAETILDVHSEGDESFTQFARGYPPGYMTVDANGDDD